MIVYRMRGIDFENWKPGMTKTTRGLFQDMLSLLEKRSFRRITIKDICEEASLSRATFYAHFADKYDLLCGWFASFKPGLYRLAEQASYKELEIAINDFNSQHKKVILNILSDADAETNEIMQDFALCLLGLSAEEAYDREPDEKHSILAIFFAGGVANYMLKEAGKSSYCRAADPNIADIIKVFREW